MLLDDLIPILHLAIGPAILVSGVGLLILSMTNRFGRVIDRTRILAHEIVGATSDDRSRISAQVKILSTRARLLRAAIALALTSALLAAVLVTSLFIGALLKLQIAALLVILFILCLLCLILSILLYIGDVNLSLKALWLEMPDTE